MLKIIGLVVSTCLALHFPVEILSVLVLFVLLVLNSKRLFYLNFLNDNLSTSLVILRLFIIILCILTNVNLTKNKKYLTCNLFLLIFLILSFYVKNLIPFFVLFESSLIPLFLLILGWGYQPERLQASVYFLFYTLLGSLPLLVTLLNLRKNFHLRWDSKSGALDIIIYLSLVTAFLIKMPMFLVHLWLPKAHVEAPTIGSMILAGITLKLGRYALLRIITTFRLYSLKYNWIWISVRLIGNLLLCIVCLRQIDLKSLIAYSSVVHMGLCLVTILFALNWSFEGGLWLSLSHGMASSGLFYLTNRTYLRFNSRRLYINKGLAFTIPLVSLWLFMLLIFNMASPPSLNLFREIKMVRVTLTISSMILILSVISRFFCACYCVFLFSTLFHGKHNNSQKFANNILILEHFILMYHIWPLVLSLILISRIQWIRYLLSLSQNNDLWYHRF